MKDTSIYTGLRLSSRQHEKLGELSESLKISRNRVIGLLIDGATVESRPILAVRPETNNRHDATNLTGSSVTAVAK